MREILTWMNRNNSFQSKHLNHWPLGNINVILKNIIFNLNLLIGIFKSSYDNVIRWMLQDLTDDKSTLVQVMAWCHQATNHYLSQCWPRSPMPYGITRPQWVNYSCILKSEILCETASRSQSIIMIWLYPAQHIHLAHREISSAKGSY